MQPDLRERAGICTGVVKIFGGQDYEQRRFGRAAAQFRQLRMKEQIAAADGIDYLTSESRSGTSVITVYMRLTYSSADAQSSSGDSR